MYQPWDPRLTQEKFAKTVTNALAHGLTGEDIVYPIVSLGASYHRNTSHYPDINFMVKETLRGFPFFDMGGFDFTGNGGGATFGGYDPAFSMLLGAQVNQGGSKFGSKTRLQALGPWEHSAGATFFPSIFAIRAAPSTTGVTPWNPPGTSSSVIMDHFIAFVDGATTKIEVGPF